MREIIKNGLILFTITIIAGTLLGFTFEITKEPINDAQVAKTQVALSKIFSDSGFSDDMSVIEEAQIETYPHIVGYYEVFDSSDTSKTDVNGYAFSMITPDGYGGDIEFLVGIHVDGYVTGIDIIKHSETPGLGAKASEAEFKDQFIERALGQLEVVKSEPSSDTEIQAISAATITSRAVTYAVNQAIEFYENELIGEVE